MLRSALRTTIPLAAASSKNAAIGDSSADADPPKRVDRGVGPIQLDLADEPARDARLLCELAARELAQGPDRPDPGPDRHAVRRSRNRALLELAASARRRGRRVTSAARNARSSGRDRRAAARRAVEIGAPDLVEIPSVIEAPRAHGMAITRPGTFSAGCPPDLDAELARERELRGRVLARARVLGLLNDDDGVAVELLRQHEGGRERGVSGRARSSPRAGPAPRSCRRPRPA